MSLNAKARLLAAGYGLLVIGVLFSWVEFTSCREAAADSSDQLEECQGLAQQIVDSRHGPERAALTSLTAGEITETIQVAFDESGLPATAISLIDPQGDRRAGKSAYRVQLTRIELNALTLAEIVGFLENITEQDTSLSISALRLTASASAAASPSASRETWLSEVTLTRLIYDPITRPPR